jgi:hypothetical protein
MTPATFADLITDDALACTRKHPEFRAAVENAAAHGVAHFRSLAAPYQWITKDVGRAAICVNALILHLVGGLTVHSLTAACVENGISSPGRVQQVVRRCQDMGEMTIEAGDGLWTRRPMRLGDGLVGALRDRALVDLRSTLRLAPDLAPTVEIVQTDDGFVAYAVAISIVASLRPDLFSFRSIPPVGFFLDREAGMLILFDLLAAQAPDRKRLLEAAPISRYALARRYSVSRAHINKLLAESGTIECVDSDQVVFRPALSRAMERHFAAVFQLNYCAAQALAAGWRFGRRAAAKGN